MPVFVCMCNHVSGVRVCVRAYEYIGVCVCFCVDVNVNKIICHAASQSAVHLSSESYP